MRWRRDGRELFYIALDGRMMAVSIRPSRNGEVAEPGEPVPLFATRVNTEMAAALYGNFQSYVIAPDGSRFLMSTVVDVGSPDAITVILNWRPRP